MSYSVFVKESVIATEQEKQDHGLFDFQNVKECLRTAFKKRPNNGRTYILLLILNFAVFMFCLNTSHYDYLLVQLKYDWTIVEYSNYLSVQRICRMLGLFLLLPLLSKILKINDALVASFCTLLTIVAYLLIAIGGQISWQNSYLAYIHFTVIIYQNRYYLVILPRIVISEIFLLRPGKLAWS